MQELNDLLAGASDTNDPGDQCQRLLDPVIQFDRRQSRLLQIQHESDSEIRGTGTIAPEIQAAPLGEQVRAAARPSRLIWVASSAASILGALALVNGAALATWSQFGGRPELLTIGLPGSLAGLGPADRRPHDAWSRRGAFRRESSTTLARRASKDVVVGGPSSAAATVVGEATIPSAPGG